MTTAFVFVLLVALYALATGAWIYGPFGLASALALGWITHPVRYVVDPRYRRSTTRSWWA